MSTTVQENCIKYVQQLKQNIPIDISTITTDEICHIDGYGKRLLHYAIMYKNYTLVKDIIHREKRQTKNICIYGHTVISYVIYTLVRNIIYNTSGQREQDFINKNIDEIIKTYSELTKIFHLLLENDYIQYVPKEQTNSIMYDSTPPILEIYYFCNFNKKTHNELHTKYARDIFYTAIKQGNSYVFLMINKRKNTPLFNHMHKLL